MSDIQLFRYGKNGVSELPGKSAAIEKDLQKLIESYGGFPWGTFFGDRIQHRQDP